MAAPLPAPALLAYVRDDDVEIVAAIDRLGRNTIDVLCTVEALKAKGVSVVSMREGFDLATPADKLMLTMLAALERENLKACQLAGLERAKARPWDRRRPLTTWPSLPGVPRTPPASRRRRSTSGFRR